MSSKVTELDCRTVNRNRCNGTVTKRHYVDSSHSTSAFSGESNTVHHYQCPVCEELVGSFNLLSEGRDTMTSKMSRPTLPPLRDINYEMKRMAWSAVDLMYGNPELSFDANKTVQEVLVLEADETEMYEYKGEHYTFDQLVEHIAPKELHRLDLQERLHYVFLSHGEQIPYKIDPPATGLRPTLQTQPWLFPDMMYRLVDGSGAAYYCNSAPQYDPSSKKWMFSGLTFHLKAHKLEHTYDARNCATSLQQLCSTDLTKVRNLHDGTFVQF